MRRKRVVFVLFFISGLACFDSVSKGQEINDYPISAEIVEEILGKVGKEDATKAVPNVINALKTKFQISTPKMWSRWIDLNQKNNIAVLTRQRTFGQSNTPLVVYDDGDGIDLTVSNGSEDIRISREHLKSDRVVVIRPFYDAWSVQGGIVLACSNWDNDTRAQLWHVNSAGTVLWSSVLDVGGLAAIGDFVIDVEDSSNSIAFFLAGRKGQFVTVFDKKKGNVKYWWSSLLYPSNSEKE